MGQFLETFTSIRTEVSTRTRPTSKRDRFKLDDYIGSLVTETLSQSNKCEEYDVMSARMIGQQTTAKKITDKSRFGIKFLSILCFIFQIHAVNPQKYKLSQNLTARITATALKRNLRCKHSTLRTRYKRRVSLVVVNWLFTPKSLIIKIRCYHQ